MSVSKTVTSKDNPAVKRMISLALKKRREEEGVFLVEGLPHIHDALCGGMIPDTLAFSPAARNEKFFKGVVYHAELKDKNVFETTDDILRRATGRDNAQPALAVFRQRWKNLDEIGGGLWVVLETVRDPGNLGTIMRTVDAAGASGVILIGDCCDAWSPEAVRATMGSFARVGISRSEHGSFLQWRKGWKWRVIGTHLKSATDYRAQEYGLPLLLLMGGEQGGLSPELAAACDSLARIPMAGGAESINLAVATGIMLYEACRSTI